MQWQPDSALKGGARKRYSIEEWHAEGKRRFGVNRLQWRFVCPRCGLVQTAQDFLDADMEIDQVDRLIAFSCLGRVLDGKGCDWSLGGFFQIHTVEVYDKADGTSFPAFDFDEVVACPTCNEPNNPRHKTCNECGYPLPVHQPDTKESPE